MVTVRDVDYSKYNKAVQFTFFKKMGKVVNVVGLTIESAGPDAKLGDLCRIIPKSDDIHEAADEEILAEVVGFKDKKIGKLLIGQNMLLTVAGIIIGIPAALGVLKFLIVKLAKEYELRISVSTLSFIISIALVFGVSLVVGLMIARKNKKIDMVEALKAQE